MSSDLVKLPLWNVSESYDELVPDFLGPSSDLVKLPLWNVSESYAELVLDLEFHHIWCSPRFLVKCKTSWDFIRVSGSPVIYSIRFQWSINPDVSKCEYGL